MDTLATGSETASHGLKHACSACGRMDAVRPPHAMRGLRQLAAPLHNLAPGVWRCARPTTAAWRSGHAWRQLDVRTRSQATAVQEQRAASEPQTAHEANGAVQPPARSADAPTFQDAIARLQSYWAQFGCAICQPHNTEVMTCIGRLSRPLQTAGGASQQPPFRSYILAGGSRHHEPRDVPAREWTRALERVLRGAVHPP